MKKFIAIAAVAISLTACNGENTECTNCATQDSTAVDTTKVAVDTAKVSIVDSTRVDTAK
jgi:hypothetical protein